MRALLAALFIGLASTAHASRIQTFGSGGSSAGGSGGSSTLAVENGDVQISSPTAAIDFNDDDFTVTQSPTGEANVVISTDPTITSIRWADGTVQVSSPVAGGSGDIEGVTAGYGLSGGGTSGTVTLDLETDVTSYIQNTASIQSGATAYPELLR